MSSKVAIAVLLGPPGSGKGTQARSLCQAHSGWVHISTGDLFRAEIASQSLLGLSVKDILAQGKLVSDDVTAKVFASQVDSIVKTKSPKLLILDGFPRTGPQTKFLSQYTASNPSLGQPFYVEFKIREATVISRVADRLVNPRTGRIYHRVMNPPKVAGICDEDGKPLLQREDDKPETIKSRFKLYESQLAGIWAEAAGSRRLEIDAEGSPDDVKVRLEKAILSAI